MISRAKTPSVEIEASPGRLAQGAPHEIRESGPLSLAGRGTRPAQAVMTGMGEV